MNTDDIASINVLKGASAVALYGQRARDGVIVITTKRGRRGSTNVEVNSSLRFDRPLRLPDFQNEYAQGDSGVFDANNFTNGWDPKTSETQGQTFEQFPFNGEQTPLQAYPDNVKDFYETGKTYINSVAVAAAKEDADFRLGYTNVNEAGIVPNNMLKRNTLSLNAGSRFSEMLSARAVINYVRTDIREGGVLYSNTVTDLRNAGLAEETLANRGRIFIDEGVLEVEDTEGNITYVENNVPVQSMQDFWGGHSATSIIESGIFDASYKVTGNHLELFAACICS